MEDYKELIERLKEAGGYQDDRGNRFYKLPSEAVCRKAAQAIEQLVKERDAAVEDLFEEADSRFNTCLYCKKDADCVLDCDNALWEWRGVTDE